MSKDPLKAPELYINRELSWLEFNQRVLEMGFSENVPLLERLKFFAICSSNLDEFFLVRVAGLMRERTAQSRRRDPAGMTPAEQLQAIYLRIQKMYADQADGIRQTLAELAKQDLKVCSRFECTPEHQQFLRAYFLREILPILTPLAIQEFNPPPLLPGMQIHIAALIIPSSTEPAAPESAPLSEPNISESKISEPGISEPKIVVVPVPTQLSRFVTLPSEKGLHVAWLEDVMASNLDALFPGSEILATSAFRIARDADVDLSDDEPDDMLHAMEKMVVSRHRREAVRLTVATGVDPRIKQWLMDWLKLDEDALYEVEIVNAAALMSLANRPGFGDLKDEDWPPQRPQDLIGKDDLWEAITDGDILLFHPYESFDPVVELIAKAAEDPQVLAIKQTLYRTSGNSPIVKALELAATNGKEVTVLVELKARFDESRNISWARRLEDAGAHVIYGIAGFKTHAKAVLIIRRESQRIARYVHLSTGNYNDRTARLYSDIGLMTCDRDITSDVAAFFNLLTGYSESVGWSKLTIAPTGLRDRFLDLIDREIQISTPDRPGLIMAKVNSLQDPEIIRALYRASMAGVKIKLNVRGICCLRPGVAGVSDNIEVRSIVDRYLEHVRLFYFRNGGHEEVYLSSADWMQRNLSRRLEILFPIIEPKQRRRLIRILSTFFSDNTNSKRLRSDGTYHSVGRKKKKVRAQEVFFHEALDATRDASNAEPQFRPLTRPKE